MLTNNNSVAVKNKRAQRSLISWSGAWLMAAALLAQVTSRAADYTIGADDLLHITVFDHAELSVDVRVSQSGNITYPLIGVVQVAGLSTHDAEQVIARRLNDGKFLRQPQVSVTVGEYQSQKVGVMGQVAKPGQFALTSSDQKVLDVLAMAGGVLNDTAADEGTVLRADGQKLKIDLYRLFQGDMTFNVPVQRGDTLFVPRAPQFYIYGEVQKPGTYKLAREITLSQAISAGGGLTTRGTERRAVVTRRDAMGKERKFSIRSNDRLQPDDVVLIKESLF